MNGISLELENALVDRAKPYYENDLAYHNWDHAEDVMSMASHIAAISNHPEISSKASQLIIAAAWHDADYHLPDLAPYNTKEERSAVLSFINLPELSESDCELIASGIIDTTVDIHPKSSLFGEALHAADLGYFASNYPHFMHRLRLMREEWGSPTWEVTTERTLKFGMQVVAEAQQTMYKILPEDEATNWIDTIRSNLHQLEIDKN